MKEPRIVEIAGPRSSPGRLWVRATQRYRAARWIDDWWYERSNIPSMAISSGAEVAIWAIGLLLTPLPAVLVVTAARLSAVTNEFHTAYLAIRHRSLDIFNQPQTWVRNSDGSINRVPGFAPRTRQRDVNLPFGERCAAFVRRNASDMWTQRRRLPGFIIGVGSPIAAFVMGVAFGVPIFWTTVITYATVALQSAPLVRSGVLSLVNGSLSYFDKPQLHAPDESTDVKREPLWRRGLNVVLAKKGHGEDAEPTLDTTTEVAAAAGPAPVLPASPAAPQPRLVTGRIAVASRAMTGTRAALAAAPPLRDSSVLSVRRTAPDLSVDL